MRRPYRSIFHVTTSLSIPQVCQLMPFFLKSISLIFLPLLSASYLTKQLASFAGCLMVVLQLLASSVVWAEGSVNLNSNGGNRAALVYSSDTAVGIPLTSKIYVYAKNGETIHLGSSAMGIGQGKIIATPPSGTATTLSDANICGKIANRTQEFAGPANLLGGTTGYNDCKIDVTSDGIWQIEFISPDPTLTMNNAFNFLASADWTQSSGVRHIMAWDATVSNGATAIPGRAYANYLAINVGNDNKNFNANMYVQTKDGALYSVKTNGIAPFLSIFFSNNKGFVDSSGKRIKRSLQFIGSGNYGTMPTGYAMHIPNNPDSASDVTQKLFFNLPAADLPENSGTTWLKSVYTVPDVPPLSFIGKEGTIGQMGTQIGGNFEFNNGTGSEVSYSIKIDISGNSTYGDSNDCIITGTATTGLNTIPWSGLDGIDCNESPVDSDTSYNATLEFNVGEVHFPFIDAENNVNGFIIERISPTVTGSDPFLIYYNDKYTTNTNGSNNYSLCAATMDAGSTCYGVPPTLRDASKVGVSSGGGAHIWSANFGNKRGIDTWAYIPYRGLGNGATIQAKKADLSVAKTHSPNPQPGGTVTYTITVTNGGPSDANLVRVQDTIPNAIIPNEWTCPTLATGNNCPPNTGIGSDTLDVYLNLASGGSATFVVKGTVDSNLTSGSVTNSVTITRPLDVTNPPSGGTGDTKIETATDTFSITPANNLPLPQVKDKETSTVQDTPVQLPALEGIDTESSTDDELGIESYTITTLPANGQLRLNGASGSLIIEGQVLIPADIANIYFIPASGFVGKTTFNYTATDKQKAVSDTAIEKDGTTLRNGAAIVTITVTPNQPPVATPETLPTVPNNTASKLPLPKATDPDGTVASYIIQSLPEEEQGILYLGDPASGGEPITPGQVLTPEQAANIYFEPAEGFTGNAQFIFTARDDKGLESSPATITIPVGTPSNPPPPPVTTTVDLYVSFSGNGIGSVKSENIGGIDCDSSHPSISCSSSYGPNTTIKLVPTPAPGSQFVRWDGPEDCQEGEVTLITATQCTAVFELDPVNLTVTMVGQGTVTSNPSGMNCNHNNEPCEQGFSRNSSVTLSAKPDSGWRFEGWKGDCDHLGKVTMTFDRACQAVFVSTTTPTVSLTVETQGGLGNVSSKPGTINCGDNCQNDYSKNSLIELTVTPEPGYKFTGWSGDCSGSDNPIQVTTDNAKTCVANFAPLTASAQLEITMVGQGRIESNPLGIHCDNTLTPCNQTFESGTPVNLTVIPDVGWHFEGFKGDCSQAGAVTVTSAQKCEAIFVPASTPHVDLAVVIPSGNDSGTVTAQPGEINCGTLCNYGYARGTTVNLTATPQPGYKFVGWGGGCSGNDNPTVVMMDTAKTCTANFVLATTDDDDGDGTAGEIENGVPNKGDGNNDGIPDSKQSNVVSLPTPDGNYVTVVVDQSCQVNGIKVVEQQIPEDGNYHYPYVLDYDLGCAETEVTVYYHGIANLCDKTYRQYGPQVPGYPDTTQWQNWVTTCGTVQIDNRAVATTTFKLKDGAVGDNGGTDGQIKHISNWTQQSGRAEFSSATYLADEFGNVATMTVKRVGGCEGKLTVDYQTQDTTATVPADYSTTTGTITWEDGDCSDKTLTVPIKDDLLKEGNEDIKLTLFNGAENVDEAVLTIVDNETAQPPTTTNNGCYSLPACNVCCSSCQPNEQSSNLIIKSLVVTIKVGQTLNVLLAEGKGELVIQEIPNSTLVSLDDWKPIAKGVGEVILTGVSVGNTKMVITDSANTALKATLYINVIPDENAENLGIRSILTTIRVGQTFDMMVAGGKGTLSLTEIPSASLVLLNSWAPLGDTGAAAFSLLGVKVGETKMVMRDEATPPQLVTVHIRVVDGSTTGNNGNNGNNGNSGNNNGNNGNGDNGTIPDNYLDNRCTFANAVAINAQGQGLNTQDCFRSRINSLEVVQPNRQMLSRRQAKDVEVLGKVIVEPEHVGQIADVLIVGIHKTFLDHHSFMRNGEEWVIWDEEIGSLTPAQTQVQLPEILEVPIYRGPLDDTPGEYVVYLGYRLKEGTVVYNGIEPIHFYVGNGASIDTQSRETRSAERQEDYSSSSYEVDTNSYFEPLIQNQDNELGNYLVFPYTDMLRISTFVRVDSKHVGRPADILMAAAHYRSLDQIGYKYDSQLWSVWDNRLDSLKPVNHYHTLPATLEIPVYLDNLAGPGEFIFYVGYQLENGVTVFNGFSPIHFIIANGLGLNAQGQPVTTTARFASWTYQNGYAGNPFQATVARPVSLKATIITDREHIGKIADVLMVAVRQESQTSYQRDSQQWGQWDEQLVTLKTAIPNVTLEPIISEIPIFEGSLNDLEGSYTVYIGYRLAESGTIIYNGGETLQLNVRSTSP